MMEDWSHEEVAIALGKTVEATRALQHRALAALKRLLLDDA
jgi:DNA-directed RNA polymerase specialized sigma24 family protein